MDSTWLTTSFSVFRGQILRLIRLNPCTSAVKPLQRFNASTLQRFNDLTNHRATLVAQLDVPVGEIDKVPPAFMLRRRERNVQERPPFRTLRFANKTHVRF